MKTRYFNENGEELILGQNLTNPADAAYSTDDPRDKIYASRPANMMIKIVSGEVTYVERPITKTDLYKFNREMRERRIKTGMTVTGKYFKDGQELLAHREVVNITERLKGDAHALVTAFAILGHSSEAPLRIGQGTSIVIRNTEDAGKFFGGGMTLINSAYGIQNQCEALIKDSTDHVETRRQIRNLWSQLIVDIDLG